MSSATEPPAGDAIATNVVEEAAPPRQKTWQAGTLVYTSGALAVLFFWLLWGDFTISLKDRSVPQTLQKLLLAHGASASYFSRLLIFLPPLISIALIPYLSSKSDRHRGRWGRRIPFLLIPTPIAVASMAFIGFSPEVGRYLHRAVPAIATSEQTSILFCFGAAWTMFEFASMACGAVFGWLINDVVPRPVMGRFFGLFRAISLIAGMLFNWYLFGSVMQHYLWVFLGIGGLYGVSFIVMCLKIKEGDYPPPTPSSSVIEEDHGIFGYVRHRFWAIVGYLRLCFAHPYYLLFFISISLANIAFAPINAYSVPFAGALRMTDTWYGRWSAIQLGCSLIQAYPLGWLADKIHPIRVTMIALALYALTTFVAFFFVRSAPTFAAAHVICGTISGMWLTATAPLGLMLLPKEKFATYASGGSIIHAIGALAAGLSIGPLLDLINRGRILQNYDFHYIYIWASFFITLSLFVTFIVYRKFQSFGGERNYIAPE